MSRISFKVTGAQGQGVNSVGEICAKGLKRSGYCVFAYREYMSLIKGGHSSYQLDISNEHIQSTEELVDILVCFNHHGLLENIHEVKPGGIVLHLTPDWTFEKEVSKEIKKKKIQIIYLPVEDILRKLKARPILGNVLITSVLWSLLGQDKARLKKLVREQFQHKGEELVQKNFECIEEGTKYKDANAQEIGISLPKTKAKWKDCMLVTGSEAMGLGVIHAGCRVYVGYPMTPSSPLLSFIAGMQNRTGMVIKQAEDEITAAQMMSGAMHMGARALTATSGGGYDLMTETISLNGIIENPSVIVLAQRPGPATGLPTWTGQGDLMLAVHSAHGEFARCVISVSDSQDAFELMPEAFNIAEKYQTCVTVLTDKQIAEALWTQPMYDQRKAKIDRGNLVIQKAQLAKLQSSDRYNTSTKSGITPRWTPGHKAATYCAQGDEHNEDGTVDETADNAHRQMNKRMRKADALYAALPQPKLYGARNPDILLVGWGSTKAPVLDALHALKNHPSSGSGRKTKNQIGYLHYSYMWPLKTELFTRLAGKAKVVVSIEGNFQGQLAMLLQQETCIPIAHKILKYDGRPFFLQEMVNSISKFL